MTLMLRSKAPNPKKSDGKPFRGFRTDPETDAKLNALALRHGLNKSEVLRQAVELIYMEEFGKDGAA